MKTFKRGNIDTVELNDKLIIKIFKISILILLIIMVGVLFFQRPESYAIILVVGCGLCASFILKNTVFVRNRTIVFCLYALDLLLLLALTYFSGSTLISTLIIIILSDFYLSSDLKTSSILCAISLAMYIVCVLVARGSVHVDPIELMTSLVSDMIFFLLDFVIINLAVTVLRRNIQIQKSLAIVRERESKLKAAYDRLEDATILEERNRIAKQIHDTTGHSITTIIMQTEAAKLIIDTNREEAKEKIILANLQAVNALEELRQSVRVLSGSYNDIDLQDSLERAVQETMSGTNIIIRSSIDKIECNQNLSRLLYFSLKEGLNNGIRHGKSTAFYFELKQSDKVIEFLLSDNGKGTDMHKMELGYGLKRMKEQAENLGGKVKFSSSPGEGFEIRMIFDKEKESDKSIDS